MFDSRTRAYIRNGVIEWPVERQRQALTDLGFSGAIYEDTLTRQQLRGRSIVSMKARADMLHSTAQETGELILVSSIRILALSPVDLTAALAAAAARQATVRALDTGLEISPNAGAAEFAAADGVEHRHRRERRKRLHVHVDPRAGEDDHGVSLGCRRGGDTFAPVCLKRSQRPRARHTRKARTSTDMVDGHCADVGQSQAATREQPPKRAGRGGGVEHRLGDGPADLDRAQAAREEFRAHSGICEHQHTACAQDS